jgi:hypothetical protein
MKPKTATFAEWMETIDAILARKCAGLTSADLPDYLYRDAYDNGETAARVAHAALRNAKE